MIAERVRTPKAQLAEDISLQSSLQLIEKPEAISLISKDVDFWLLGGFSILAWIISCAAVSFSNSNLAFDRQISNWPYAFSALTLVCNNPHFALSYRLAYGSHYKKILTHWFSLIFVPIALIGLLVAAYSVNSSLYQAPAWLLKIDARWPNPILDTFATTPDLGSEFLRTGVWLMWGLVGWHYSKQVFGVMLKYAKFDSYELSSIQKNILRYCLLALIPTNFIGIAVHSRGTPNFIHDLTMIYVNFPDWSLNFCYWLDGILFTAFLGVLAKNYFANQRYPSVNFLVPFFAFYLWWVPGIWPQPFAMMMVPFFHSLQYLPFSYRRLEGEVKSSKYFTFGLTFNILTILIAGYALFDLTPAWIDEQLHTRFQFGSSFFLIASVVFINVHHFFIDSVIWRRQTSRR